MFFAGIAEVTLWEKRTIRIPTPVETILATMYGEDWRVENQNWAWNVDPYR